jgi:hypothetical protein
VIATDRIECKITQRVPHVGRVSAEARHAALCHDLQRGDGVIIDERRELIVYDGNRDLDRGWLAG